jgi:hypothetical protein
MMAGLDEIPLSTSAYLADTQHFADPKFPAPTIAVWEQSRHPWVSLPPDTPPKHASKQG